MLRANFKDDPMAHLIAPRQSYNKAASGAAIERHRRPMSWGERGLRIGAVLLALVALAAWVAP